jgi:molecular chaperone DnaK
LDEINTYYVSLTLIYQLINFIRHYDEDFNSYNWSDSKKARTLVNQGQQIISNNPNVQELHPLVISLFDLLPDDEKPSDDNSVLVG